MFVRRRSLGRKVLVSRGGGPFLGAGSSLFFCAGIAVLGGLGMGAGMAVGHPSERGEEGAEAVPRKREVAVVDILCVSSSEAEVA